MHNPSHLGHCDVWKFCSMKNIRQLSCAQKTFRATKARKVPLEIFHRGQPETLSIFLFDKDRISMYAIGEQEKLT